MLLKQAQKEVLLKQNDKKLQTGFLFSKDTKTKTLKQ
jgi:hypothetical protein